MISAPKNPRRHVAYGPAHAEVNSVTLTPPRGPLFIVKLLPEGIVVSPRMALQVFVQAEEAASSGAVSNPASNSSALSDHAGLLQRSQLLPVIPEPLSVDDLIVLPEKRGGALQRERGLGEVARAGWNL